MELTGVELNEFLLKKAGKTWDDVIEERATIDDIDSESLAQFVNDGLKYGRMPEVDSLTDIQILDKLNLFLMIFSNIYYPQIILVFHNFI